MTEKWTIETVNLVIEGDIENEMTEKQMSLLKKISTQNDLPQSASQINTDSNFVIPTTTHRNTIKK